MKFGTALAGLALLGALAVPAFAQVLTVRQATAQCPDLRAASACPAVATAFLAPRAPGPQTDAQIVNLVLALADEVQKPAVTLEMCLNTADGMRVLAGGMSDPGRAQQVRDIADALCEDTRTAAIGDTGPSAPTGTPQSLASEGEGGGGNGSTGGSTSSSTGGSTSSTSSTGGGSTSSTGGSSTSSTGGSSTSSTGGSSTGGNPNCDGNCGVGGGSSGGNGTGNESSTGGSTSSSTGGSTSSSTGGSSSSTGGGSSSGVCPVRNPNCP